ncbi:MAG TPA: hypothetical protein DCZ41_04580, partial [Firmicutes bacterium]|nr:hypothetical protein [Bacillota bacterium]
MTDRNKQLEAFSEDYYEFTEGNRDRFAKVINRLLGETFLVKEKDEDVDDYFFLAEHQTMVANYFSIIDYEFVFDYENSLAYIKTTENRNRVRLNKLDTAILFVLRILEIEAKKKVTSQDKVIISLEEIVEQLKIAGLLDYAKRPSFYLDSLRKLKTHKIIDFRASVLQTNTPIQVFPSIHVLLPAND